LLLYRTPLAKTVLNYFRFANPWRCTKGLSTFFYYSIFFGSQKATDPEIGARGEVSGRRAASDFFCFSVICHDVPLLVASRKITTRISFL
jgi:hypothetical protein